VGSYGRVSTSTAVLSQLQLGVGKSSWGVLDKAPGDGFYNSYLPVYRLATNSESSFEGLKLNTGTIIDIWIQINQEWTEGILFNNDI